MPRREEQYEERGRRGRGFAGMDPEERREIARRGGRAAHHYGRAHEWSEEEAAEMGRRGGRARGFEGEEEEGDYCPECGRPGYRGRTTPEEAGRRGSEARGGRGYEEEEPRGRGRRAGRRGFEEEV